MINAARYRKIALFSQGLTLSRPFGSGSTAIADAIDQLGYVQIDTISVVQRAHHHVFWSRVPDYRAEALDELIAGKEVFEYWFHAAAFLPMKHYRFALLRMHEIKSGRKHWFSNTSRKLMKEIYQRVEAEGPLRARDFQDTKKGKGGWWEWKPAKQALEQLFIEGDLMVIGREGFQKRYDIRERALPSYADTSLPTLQEYADHLIDVTLRAHGFAALRSFSYLRKGADLRLQLKNCLQQRIAEGRLLLTSLPGGEPVYIDPQLLDQSIRLDRKVRFLSPFDNSLIQRQRCRSVFDFEFQIECYVPAAKRQYGYFCLPILYRDQFVGRADCKADRKNGELRVLLLDLESDLHQRTENQKVKTAGINADDGFVLQLANALQRFMIFNRCDRITLESVRPKILRAPLMLLLDQC